jgi:hypothetical protein
LRGRWREGRRSVIAAIFSTVAAGAPLVACAQSGRTYDFPYHDDTSLFAGQSLAGRLYVPGAVSSGERVPLVVFLHGRNGRGVKHMWLGDPFREDLRLVLDKLLERRQAGPLLLAGPSQTRDAYSSLRLWSDFDLDDFTAAVEGTLQGRARIRRDSVVLIGHSGAGCNPDGGLARAAANGSSPAPHAIVAIDTCLDSWVAYKFSQAPADLDLWIYFQREEWPRPFQDFRQQLAEATPARALGRWKTVEVSDLYKDRHNTIVPEALARALAELFPPSGV